MSQQVRGRAEPKASSVRSRLGFLGVGWIGRNRMKAILDAGVAEIAAIADPSAQMLSEARDWAPKAQVTATLDDLLAMDLDGIVIATPSAMHAEQSIRALEQGFAVFCQKPLGRTQTEVRSIIDVARRADRLLGVDLSYRFTEGMRRIHDLVHSGELGHIYAIDLVFHNAYGPNKAWFYNPVLAGGGCVMDLGVHLVDLALWALDYPDVSKVSSRLFAGGEPLSDLAAKVEDYAVAMLGLGTGAVVQLACSWKLQTGCDAMISATFYGTQGGASLRNLNGSFYDFIAERYRGTAREALSMPPDEWGGRAAVDWARRLSAGERFDPAVERLIDVAHVLDRIYGR